MDPRVIRTARPLRGQVAQRRRGFWLYACSLFLGRHGCLLRKSTVRFFVQTIILELVASFYAGQTPWLLLPVAHHRRPLARGHSGERLIKQGLPPLAPIQRAAFCSNSLVSMGPSLGNARTHPPNSNRNRPETDLARGQPSASASFFRSAFPLAFIGKLSKNRNLRGIM